MRKQPVASLVCWALLALCIWGGALGVVGATGEAPAASPQQFPTLPLPPTPPPPPALPTPPGGMEPGPAGPRTYLPFLTTDRGA